MIAGVNSSTGKTTISLGIMAALRRRGMKVQPFKVGPDYIDPGLHTHATGCSSHNLDSWMCGTEVLQTVFAKNAYQADLSIVEGVMGYFDGMRGERILGSSAHVASILEAPVILVVDVRGMSQSCVAVVKGFMEYQPQGWIRGVILNHATEFHKIYVCPFIESELGVKALGCMPSQESLSMPERHLGLLPADENEALAVHLERMADWVEKYVDLDEVVNIAEKANPLALSPVVERIPARVAIGVARDQAFSFYYRDSLDYLEELGAELHYFSPMKDAALPPVDGLYFGGGFPEMFLDSLSGNTTMLDSIRQAHAKGLPILAECGGLMYLCRGVVDWDGKYWPGVGIVPADIQMTRRLQALGYLQATALKDTILGSSGHILMGHEFHYSTMTEVSPEDLAFTLDGGLRPGQRVEGFAKDNLLASYLHLQLRANADAARNFLNACALYRSA